MMKETNFWIILIPIWGETHINMCADFILPALLAPDNIPYLSKHDSVTIRFLTTELSSRYLQNNNVCKKISNFANISYIFIDDLVSLGEYGLTLTMAYERGIQTDAPELQVKQSYIFLNGDMVTSNNTFRTIHDKIKSGYSAVVSPGVRVIAQDVEPILTKIRTDADGMINCSGRELVSLTLNNLHPTVIAAKINNTTIGTSISHQYYAQVNDTLLIARFFLLFMLCIKPERPLEMVTSYCDYSFIPELCPSDNYAVISDSDEAFLMELSPLEQESSYIYLGKKNLYFDSQRMLNWVTKQQFDYSEHLLYFHVEDIPASGQSLSQLNSAKLELNNTLNTVRNVLQQQSHMSHKYHPYWNNQINTYKMQGKLLNRKSINFRKGIPNRILNILFNKVLGNAPLVTKLHYKYRDYRNCIQAINAELNKDYNKILYVCGDRKDLFIKYFAKLNNANVSTIRIDDINHISNIMDFNIIFLELNVNNLQKAVTFIKKNIIQKSCKVIIYIDTLSIYRHNNGIMPYLCLLDDYVQPTRLIASSANIKHKYYNSSINFMKELYGKRNIFKLIQYLLLFIYNLTLITASNLKRPKCIEHQSIENMSSIVLKF